MPNLVARKTSSRFPVPLNLINEFNDAIEAWYVADLHMFSPFTNQFLTIAIDIGGVPERATTLESSIQNLCIGTSDTSVATSSCDCTNLQPFFIRASIPIVSRDPHGAKTDSRNRSVVLTDPANGITCGHCVSGYSLLQT